MINYLIRIFLIPGFFGVLKILVLGLIIWRISANRGAPINKSSQLNFYILGFLFVLIGIIGNAIGLHINATFRLSGNFLHMHDYCDYPGADSGSCPEFSYSQWADAKKRGYGPTWVYAHLEIAL